MELGDRITSGSICVDFIKPIGFFKYLFFNRVGVIVFNFMFSIIPLLVTAVFIFKINILTNTLRILIFSISVLLSFFIVYIFEFLIGLTSFWTTQIFGVSLLKSSLVNILSGLTVPLSFYPDILRGFLLNLPFQAMYYIPVSIYLDLPYESNLLQKFLLSIGLRNKALDLILEQLFWVIVVAFVTALCWQVAKKRLVIQGG
jgi:ABC-2 type transport system permease protein